MSALHLWPFTLGSAVACVLVVVVLPRSMMALTIVGTSLLLPVFTAATTTPLRWYRKLRRRLTLG